MNRDKAREIAGQATVGDLRVHIVNRLFSAMPGEVSVVNPLVSLNQAVQIYSSALQGKRDNEPLPSWQRLIAENILRDCAP
mgnify:CR=1 FL=1